MLQQGHWIQWHWDNLPPGPRPHADYYTGIVSHDLLQLTVANFLSPGDTFMLLKSIKGVMSGVFDNMFANSNKVFEIVQMEGQFSHADQVVDWNTVRGTMKEVDDGSEGGSA